MAHVSGGIMAAYIAYGIEAKHLLAAVIMTAPGTILMSKMLVPETEMPLDERASGNGDAGAAIRTRWRRLRAGTSDGLNLAINVGAMLISFIALMYLVDGFFGVVHNALAAHGHIGWFPSSLEQIFGWIFSPVAWLIGIPWQDCHTIGNLLGLRMVTNELVAFQRLGPMKATLDPRSFTIATFALCGFANFSSIGIQIGGIGALAPNRKARSGAAWDTRDAGGDDGEFDVGVDCGNFAAMSARRALKHRSGVEEFARVEAAAKFICSKKTKLRPRVGGGAGLGTGRVCG